MNKDDLLFLHIAVMGYRNELQRKKVQLEQDSGQEVKWLNEDIDISNAMLSRILYIIYRRDAERLRRAIDSAKTCLDLSLKMGFQEAQLPVDDLEQLVKHSKLFLGD